MEDENGLVVLFNALAAVLAYLLQLLVVLWPERNTVTVQTLSTPPQGVLA